MPPCSEVAPLGQLGVSQLFGVTNRCSRAGIRLRGNGKVNRLTQLQSLDLRICKKITDAGLEHLRGLTQLRNLNLSSTQVTDAGVHKLEAASPAISIGR